MFQTWKRGVSTGLGYGSSQAQSTGTYMASREPEHELQLGATEPAKSCIRTIHQEVTRIRSEIDGPTFVE